MLCFPLFGSDLLPLLDTSSLVFRFLLREDHSDLPIDIKSGNCWNILGLKDRAPAFVGTVNTVPVNEESKLSIDKVEVSDNAERLGVASVISCMMLLSTICGDLLVFPPSIVLRTKCRNSFRRKCEQHKLC